MENYYFSSDVYSGQDKTERQSVWKITISVVMCTGQDKTE